VPLRYNCSCAPVCVCEGLDCRCARPGGAPQLTRDPLGGCERCMSSLLTRLPLTMSASLLVACSPFPQPPTPPPFPERAQLAVGCWEVSVGGRKPFSLALDSVAQPQVSWAHGPPHYIVRAPAGGGWRGSSWFPDTATDSLSLDFSGVDVSTHIRVAVYSDSLMGYAEYSPFGPREEVWADRRLLCDLANWHA